MCLMLMAKSAERYCCAAQIIIISFGFVVSAVPHLSTVAHIQLTNCVRFERRASERALIVKFSSSNLLCLRSGQMCTIIALHQS